jgi:hypothetical protein
MLKVCRTIEKTISSPCLAHLLNLVIEELIQPYACNKDKNKLTAQERSYVEYPNYKLMINNYKKQSRRIQRRNIKKYESKRYFSLEQLTKTSNKDAF